MSKKYNRRQVAIELASRALAKITTNPNFILGNYVKPRPRFIPKILWAWFIKLVIKFPKR